MQLCTAQSFCSQQIIPRHSDKLPRCKGSNSLMLEKMSFSKTKHSIRPKLKHVLPLSRLIVFPSSTGLPGIQNHLSQESNYCERGVLVWIAWVEFASIRGRQPWLSTQAITELSKQSSGKSGGIQLCQIHTHFSNAVTPTTTHSLCHLQSLFYSNWAPNLEYALVKSYWLGYIIFFFRR